MNEKFKLKLQAYADGELSEHNAREVADWLAKDADGRALLVELMNTRSALSGFEAETRLPETREFYWSKIAREIEYSERAVPLKGASFSVFRRFFLPVGALATLIIAGLLVSAHLKPPGATEVEVAMAGSDPFTYRDDSSGTTLVWLSYPSESDFADAETDDTID